MLYHTTPQYLLEIFCTRQPDLQQLRAISVIQDQDRADRLLRSQLNNKSGLTIIPDIKSAIIVAT